MSNTNDGLSRINHIVVLMLENRSFDNVLGWLYFVIILVVALAAIPLMLITQQGSG